MKKRWRFVVAIIIAILVNVLSIGGVLLWCRHLSETQEVPEGVESTVTVDEHLESVVVQDERFFIG